MRAEPKLYRSLTDYVKTDIYPFHMPGHKRQFSGLYAMDITEIEGFDNLHHPEGILKESMEWAASVYGADQTYYLVNGSTCGILSAIGGLVPEYGTILMSRNCHKAAYHGAILNHLKVIYVYPQCMEEYGFQCGLSPEKIDELLRENPEISAVLIVSPTYEGIVSDVGAISEICHQHQVPLIVDEAHGAHFPFGDPFPESALDRGADVVIQSVHKTLPCLTQSAILHIKGPYVDRKRLERYLQVYQSSSPSYLLMAGIERGIWWMEQEEGKRKRKEFSFWLQKLRQELETMNNLKLFGSDERGNQNIYDIDTSKMIISTRKTSITGKNLSERLRREYHLELEMAAMDYVIAMTTVMDTKEGLNRLGEALLSIDKNLAGRESESQGVWPDKNGSEWEAWPVVTMSEAWNGRKKPLPFKESTGKISAEFVYLYPPGIPVIAPGERLTEEIVNLITMYKTMGLPVQGMSDRTNETIFVLAEGEDGSLWEN